MQPALTQHLETALTIIIHSNTDKRINLMDNLQDVAGLLDDTDGAIGWLLKNSSIPAQPACRQTCG